VERTSDHAQPGNGVGVDTLATRVVHPRGSASGPRDSGDPGMFAVFSAAILGPECRIRNHGRASRIRPPSGLGTGDRRRFRIRLAGWWPASVADAKDIVVGYASVAMTGVVTALGAHVLARLRARHADNGPIAR